MKKEKIEFKTKTFKMLLTDGDSIVIEGGKIHSFGKWNSPTSSSVTKDKIYAILGEGDFGDSVKFLNNNANIDEASTNHFGLATRSQYSQQNTPVEKDEPPITLKKLNEELKVAKRQRSVANVAQSGNKKMTTTNKKLTSKNKR